MNDPIEMGDLGKRALQGGALIFHINIFRLLWLGQYFPLPGSTLMNGYLRPNLTRHLVELRLQLLLLTLG
ncbi:hypothetical protein ASC87_08030 [Rhizobacter sp. Root1221]|nr:hypothetical protein ASC87_08030 [Rhizobacter sp. Root1221]